MLYGDGFGCGFVVCYFRDEIGNVICVVGILVVIRRLVLCIN